MMQCMSIVHHLSLVPGALDHGQTYRVTFEQVEVPNPVLASRRDSCSLAWNCQLNFLMVTQSPWSSQMWPKPEWLTPHLTHSHSHRSLSLWLARFQGSTLAKRKLLREQAHAYGGWFGLVKLVVGDNKLFPYRSSYPGAAQRAERGRSISEPNRERNPHPLYF